MPYAPCSLPAPHFSSAEFTSTSTIHFSSHASASYVPPCEISGFLVTPQRHRVHRVRIKNSLLRVLSGGVLRFQPSIQYSLLCCNNLRTNAGSFAVQRERKQQRGQVAPANYPRLRLVEILAASYCTNTGLLA